MFAQKSVHAAPHPYRSAYRPNQQQTPGLIEHPSLAYNLAETHAEFRARQRSAYDAGRYAWQERCIPTYLLPFYESLVERVGANTYSWVSEDTLAEAFQVDVSTIKRWIAKLVQAGLIRRQRQFGTSSRTYITAYDPTTILLTGEADTPAMTDVSLPVEDDRHDDDELHMDTAPQEDQPIPGEGRSFRRTHEPSFGADLRRDLKDSHLKLLSGGANERSHESKTEHGMNPEIMQFLEREGAHSLESTPKLLLYPVEELHAVSAYLDTQRNVEDRPKLFAWLVLRDFGRKLLTGAHEARQTNGTPDKQRRSKAPLQADDPRRASSGSCRDLVHDWQEEERNGQPTTSTSENDHGHTENTQLWQQVMDRLQTMLPGDALIWFAETEVLELTDERAVIGTPTCIERDTLRTAYQEAIREAFQLVTGQPRRVQIEIGRSEPILSPVPPGRSAARSTATRRHQALTQTDLWQQVLDELRRAVTDGEFQIWFAEAQLLQLEDGEAIIGTPNIFAREQLQACYAQHLREALMTIVGQPVTVQVVIGS